MTPYRTVMGEEKPTQNWLWWPSSRCSRATLRHVKVSPRPNHIAGHSTGNVSPPPLRHGPPNVRCGVPGPPDPALPASPSPGPL